MLTNDSKKIIKFITNNHKHVSRGFKELHDLFKHLKTIDNSHDYIVSNVKKQPYLSDVIVVEIH